jgi:hypothetical protein
VSTKKGRAGAGPSLPCLSQTKRVLVWLAPPRLIVGRVERSLECVLDFGRAPLDVGLPDEFTETVDRPAVARLPGVRMPFGWRQRGVIVVELSDQGVNAFLVQPLFEVGPGSAPAEAAQPFGRLAGVSPQTLPSVNSTKSRVNSTAGWGSKGCAGRQVLLPAD